MHFQDIDEFIAGLAGPAQSSGTFTLELNKAQEKLSQFQLSEPDLYPVMLVAAAVSAGARCFKAVSGLNSVLFEFDGRPLRLDSYQADLFPNSQNPLSQRFLAVALSAAEKICEEFHLHSGSQSLHWTSAGSRVEERSESGQTSLSFKRRAPFLGLVTNRPPDLAQTLALCAYAPLALEVDGKKCSLEFYEGSALLWRELRGPLPIPKLIASGQYVDSVPAPGPFSGALALVVHPPGQPKGVVLVVHGISHRLDLDHLHGVIVTDALDTDLSCSRLVHNEKYRDFVTLLQSEGYRMFADRIGTGKALPNEQRPCFQAVAEEARVYFEEIGQQTRAVEIRDWIEAGQRSLDLEHLNEVEKALSKLPPGEKEALRVVVIERLQSTLSECYRAKDWPGLLRSVEELTRFDRCRSEQLQDLLDVLQAWLDPIACPLPSPRLKYAIRALFHRLRDQPDQAEEIYARQLLSETQDAAECYIGLCEICLRRGDYETARERAELALLHQEEAASRLERASTVLAFEIRSRCQRIYELHGDCLELLERWPEMLILRAQAIPQRSSDPYLEWLRLHSLADQMRGRVPVMVWLRWRLRAVKAGWVKDQIRSDISTLNLSRSRCLVKREALESSLRKGVPGVEALESVRAELSSDPLLPYYEARLAQRLRLLGDLAGADQIAARSQLYAYLRLACNSLLYGRDQQSR